MDNQHLMELLAKVKSGRIDIDAAMNQLKKLPFENLGYARIDNHRCVRTGVSEVIYCEGKSVEQTQGIVGRLAMHHDNIMATRAGQEMYEGIAKVTNDCEYHPEARIVVINPRATEPKGNIAVVTAGTSDIPVAEEAAVTAETLGNRVNRIFDAGVAGIHRILNVRDDLFQANVAIVVAGMEGALTSVVGVRLRGNSIGPAKVSNFTRRHARYRMAPVDIANRRQTQGVCSGRLPDTLPVPNSNSSRSRNCR